MSHFWEFTGLWQETNLLYAQWAKAHGLSMTELLVALSLVEQPQGCRQKDICDRWALPKQTVNSLLKHWHMQNWVISTPDETDRRARRVTLTRQGLAYAGEIARQLIQTENQVWQRMGEETSQEFLAASARYNQYFREACEDEGR